MRILQGNYDLTDPQGRTDFFHEVAGRLLKFEDEIERNSYLEAVARLYHIQADMLEKLVNKLALKGVGLAEQPKPKIPAKQRLSLIHISVIQKGPDGLQKLN